VKKTKFHGSAHFCSKTAYSVARLTILWATENSCPYEC